MLIQSSQLLQQLFLGRMICFLALQVACESLEDVHPSANPNDQRMYEQEETFISHRQTCSYGMFLT